MIPETTNEFRRRFVSTVFVCGLSFIITPVQAGENLWRHCSAPDKSVLKKIDLLAVPDVSSGNEISSEIVFSADQVEVIGSQYRLKGKVTGGRGGQQLSADSLNYDKDTGIAQATGNVRYEQAGRTITGDSAEINLEKDSGFISPARFWIADRHMRGSADSLHIEGPTVTRLEEGFFTTCDEGSNDWILKASSLRLDTEKNEGVARHARINFMSVPIFYFPYLSFPLQGRKTGFMVPSFGDSSDSGTELSVPYYWNIAPHRDATLVPRFLSRRGLLMESEFRYLNERSHGEIELAHLSDDRVFGDDRTALHFRHQGDPAPGWRTRMEYRYISDQDYLNDFGSDLATSSVTHLERRADVDYRNDYFQAKLLLQSYQTLDETLPETSKPYQRLPQLQINTQDWQGPAGIKLGLGTEFVRFDRTEGVVGTRQDFQPRVSWPWRGDSGFLIPKLTFRHTQYQLQKSDPGFDDSPTRSLPIFSMDSGLVFERDLTGSSVAKMQTLEPRLFYLHVPYRQQENLIVDELGADSVFDSSLTPFSFGQMFRSNRFTGGDRVGDANQLSGALTTRFLDQGGRELLSASVGRTFYFWDREVTLPGGVIETNTTSDWVAEIKGRWTPSFSARASMQWDTVSGKMERGSANILYHKDNRRLLRMAYRYEENTIEQGDIAVIWPLASRWNLVGRWLHSLRDNVTLETLKGIEYESCCWTARIVQRMHRVDALDDSESDSIWIQLELKGLTSVGKPVKNLLARDILSP